MPFKSQKQRSYLYARKPEIAKEFASKTPKNKKLPDRINQLQAIKRKMKHGV